MLAAQRYVHIVAADDNLFALLYHFAVNNPGNHGCLAAAPAYGLDFFYLVRIYEHVIRAFKQFVTEIIFQTVSKYRHFAAVYYFCLLYTS